MSAAVAGAAPSAPARPSRLLSKIAWHWRHDPKIELWIIWWAMVGFYQLFGVVFVLMTHVMPPPKPWWDQARIAQWFSDYHTGILVGFAIIFLVSGLVPGCNAIIAYSMRRMSVSKAFAYSYITIYSLSAIPGMLYAAIFLSVGAMRPDRDPRLIAWLYDAGFLTFVGTLGFFLIGTIVWMIAILLDKNRVFPKWFGYLNIANAITELVVAPCWMMKSGAFAWNGSIAFWVDTGVFALYTCVFIVLLRKMVVREDFGDGPLPDVAS
jgi:hypothetical protein